MSEWTDKRPMSPHIWQWRWHITMLGSILHRMTGIASYVGAVLIVAWLFVTTFGEDRYNEFASIIASIPAQVILFSFILSILYHALNGIRHLVWDAGHGFTPKLASATGAIVIVLSVLGAVAIWIVAGLVPGVDPLGVSGQ